MSPINLKSTLALQDVRIQGQSIELHSAFAQKLKRIAKVIRKSTVKQLPNRAVLRIYCNDKDGNRAE